MVTIPSLQKIAIDVQRGSAASVMVTIPSLQDWAEFISLPLVCGFASDDFNAVVTVWLLMMLIV